MRTTQIKRLKCHKRQIFWESKEKYPTPNVGCHVFVRGEQVEYRYMFICLDKQYSGVETKKNILISQAGTLLKKTQGCQKQCIELFDWGYNVKNIILTQHHLHCPF